MTDARAPLPSDLAALLDSRRDGHGMPRAFYGTAALYEAELRVDLAWRLALRRLRVRDSRSRRLPDAHDRRDTRRGDPRRRRRRARVPQRLPAPRHPALPRGHRASARDRLPVSQLDVLAPGRADRVPRHARRHRQVRAGPAARARRSGDRLRLRVARRNAPAFDALRRRFVEAGTPQGFDRARVAKSVEYEVDANWKLVWENNRECYHCTPRHPQYVRSNFDVYDEEQAPEPIRQRIAAAIARTQSQWDAPGDAATHPKGGLATFPDPDRDLWYTCNRTALAEGFVTESLDGERVAPLMGDYRGRRRRRAADAQPAELLAARELRPRGGDADAARGAAQDADEELVARAPGRARGCRLSSSTACCRSGTSRTSRTGRSASGSRRASTRSATSPARCRSARNTTSTRSSAGICSRCAPAARGRPATQALITSPASASARWRRRRSAPSC